MNQCGEGKCVIVTSSDIIEILSTEQNHKEQFATEMLQKITKEIKNTQDSVQNEADLLLLRYMMFTDHEAH